MGKKGIVDKLVDNPTVSVVVAAPARYISKLNAGGAV
jgi:hypothetical protein